MLQVLLVILMKLEKMLLGVVLDKTLSISCTLFPLWRTLFQTALCLCLLVLQDRCTAAPRAEGPATQLLYQCRGRSLAGQQCRGRGHAGDGCGYHAGSDDKCPVIKVKRNDDFTSFTAAFSFNC